MKNLRWIQSAAACFLALILGAEQVSAAVTLGGEGTVYPEKEHAEVSLGEMSRELFVRSISSGPVILKQRYR